jgi:cytochrome c oxidase cbb3-type subunit 3
MPTKVEKDAFTGTQTTGHEWDGIKELDSPLPKWWLYVFYACIAWSLVYYVLYPAIPYVTGYTKGLLGTSTRAELVTEITRARGEQAGGLRRQLRALPRAGRRRPGRLSHPGGRPLAVGR